MNHSYDDILRLTDEPPKWWDEHAVPRFDAFSPTETANVYADEAALLEIACQACDHRFDVCMSRTFHDAQMDQLYASALDAWKLLRGEVESTTNTMRTKLVLNFADVKKLVGIPEPRTLADEVRDNRIHYGDPPNACPGDCFAGATMNSIPVRVVEFWSRDSQPERRFREWVRHAELEVPIRAEWWDGPEDYPT